MIEKSAGGGREAAVEAAEERASSDCASEAAGELRSSTAVSMAADMMCGVQGKCERRKRRKSEIQRREQQETHKIKALE